MSDETLELMAEDYLGLGFPSSAFTWQGGEPTLAGLDFYRKVVATQVAAGSGGQLVGNALQTNGVLIDEDWAEFMAEYSFLVGLSLDGPPEIHDRYRRNHDGAPTFERVRAAADILRRYSVEFNILCMITDYSESKGRDIYRYLVSEGFYHLQFIPCVEYDPATGEPSPYNVSPEGYGRFMSDVFDEWYARDIGHVSVRTFEALVGRLVGDEQLGICTIGTACDHYLVVEKEGDVYPCDFFVGNDYFLGNIRKSSLQDIRCSERAMAFARIKGNYSETCRTCRYLDLCYGGCPKDRLCAGRGDFARVTEICDGLKLFYDNSYGRLRELAQSLCTERRWNGRGQTPNKPSRKVGRNDPCPCGSGKKYKHCCMR